MYTSLKIVPTAPLWTICVKWKHISLSAMHFIHARSASRRILERAPTAGRHMRPMGAATPAGHRIEAKWLIHATMKAHGWLVRESLGSWCLLRRSSGRKLGAYVISPCRRRALAHLLDKRRDFFNDRPLTVFPLGAGGQPPTSAVQLLRVIAGCLAA